MSGCAISTVYVEVFRGTSALVQLFWFYFVLPMFGVRLPASLVGIVVLVLNAGAYGAEVVRGAIQAVPSGQREAGFGAEFHAPADHEVRHPAAGGCRPCCLQRAICPAGNLFIELLKNTALASLITITDLTFRGQLLRGETLQTTEIFSIMLLMYFAVALCITAMVCWLGEEGAHPMSPIFDWKFAWEILPSLGSALIVTLQATVLGMLFAVVFGLVLALLRRPRW